MVQMNWDNFRFILFCVGLLVAIFTSTFFLFTLCLNLNNVNLVNFEQNSLIASFETALLIIAIATCAAALEIYYKYLKMRSQA